MKSVKYIVQIGGTVSEEEWQNYPEAVLGYVLTPDAPGALEAARVKACQALQRESIFLLPWSIADRGAKKLAAKRGNVVSGEKEG